MSYSSPAATRMLHSLQEMPELEAILEAIRRLTRQRIALVARVEADRWTCCAVLDDADFGLEVGSSLDVSTTY